MKSLIPDLVMKFFPEIVAPRHCEVCGKHITGNNQRFEFLCNKCFDAIPYAPPPEEIYNNKMRNFNPDDFILSDIFSLFSLKEENRYMNLVYALKYHGFNRVGYELGAELAKVIRYHKPQKYDFIVPVPIHKVRIRERGYNQSDYIAQGVSSVLGVPVNNQLVKRSKYTQTQTLLDSDQRKTNVDSVFIPFRSSVDLQDMRILIVDDVYTTGSTINSLAICLTGIGAKSIDAATLAVA